jgi:hypothetical protein
LLEQATDRHWTVGAVAVKQPWPGTASVAMAFAHVGVLPVLAFAADDPNPIDVLTNANAATKMAARRSTTILDFMVQLSSARDTLYGSGSGTVPKDRQIHHECKLDCRQCLQGQRVFR